MCICETLLIRLLFFHTRKESYSVKHVDFIPFYNNKLGGFYGHGNFCRDNHYVYTSGVLTLFGRIGLSSRILCEDEGLETEPTRGK